MGAEEGGDDPHRPPVRKRPGGAQHLQFVVKAQPIARLDLDGAGALGQQGVETRQAFLHQVGLGGGAHGLHGRDDAAAGAGNGLIRGAFQPEAPFVGAVAGVDEMRMRIDQGRGEQAATTIDNVGGIEGRRFGPAAGIDNASGTAGYDAVGNDRTTVGHRHQACICPEAIKHGGPFRLNMSRHIVMYRHNPWQARNGLG